MALEEDRNVERGAAADEGADGEYMLDGAWRRVDLDDDGAFRLAWFDGNERIKGTALMTSFDTHDTRPPVPRRACRRLRPSHAKG